MSDALVIIPTYNELENIEAIIEAVLSQDKDFDILVVDDNSPDGTSSKVKSLQFKYKNVLYLEERSEKSGLGTAYIHGFKWALDNHYEYVFEMDADFSHDPKDLIRLYNSCKNGGADFAIGSRYLKGINVVNWPLGRILLSYFASIYVRVITGMKIYDTTAGFVCIKRHVLQNIDFNNIQFVGYAFQIEMKFQTYLKKYKIVEIPYVQTKDDESIESKSFPNLFTFFYLGSKYLIRVFLTILRN